MPANEGDAAPRRTLQNLNKDICPTVATYSLVIRRLMIVSLTIVVSRAITSPLLTLFLSNKLGLNQQDVGLLLGIAVFHLSPKIAPALGSAIPALVVTLAVGSLLRSRGHDGALPAAHQA